MHRALLIFCLAKILSAQSNPFAGDAAAIDLGKGNFRLYCGACHGIHAQGGRGPDLTRGAFSAGDSDADLFHVISTGVPGTEMAGYAERFDDKMIWRFIAYIRSVSHVAAGPVPGDAQHGSEVFWGKGGCGGCHAVGARGGDIGPSLSRVGRQRSLEFLRQKMVKPASAITPGYTTVAVTLRDGKMLRGIEKGFDDFSVQLLDANKKYYSFRKGEVLSFKREDKSLMPADYGQKLSSSELTDVLAYLASLRGDQ
jgi:putative heme-binding domain-containing protein